METLLIFAIVIPATMGLMALFGFTGWIISDACRIGPRFPVYSLRDDA